MNPQNAPIESTSSPMLGLLLLIGLAYWCWLSRGPRFLRWPLVILIVMITSGHQLGGIVSAYAGALAGPILLLLIVSAGLMIMIRGLGWRPRGRSYRDNRYGRGWYDNR